MNDLYLEDLDRIIGNDLPWENLSGKNVLVTGATGLIGSCIVDLLMRLNNVNVFAMGRSVKKGKDRFSHYLSNPNFKFICHDVSNSLNIDIWFDYIIHAASGAHPVEFNERPVETMIGNFLGMYNLLNYTKVHNVKRFLYVSSGEVYGECDKDSKCFIEEDSGYVDPLKVRSCYPISKRATETLLVSYSKEYGVDGVIVRPCHVYGPTITKDDSRAVAEFIRNAVNGEDIIVKGSGKQVRAYSYVTDVVSALFYVLFLGKSNEAYNISGDEVVSIKELANICSKVSGSKVVLLGNNSDKAVKTVLNCKKILKLGWRSNVSLGDGIKRSIDILKKV